MRLAPLRLLVAGKGVAEGGYAAIGAGGASDEVLIARQRERVPRTPLLPTVARGPSHGVEARVARQVPRAKNVLTRKAANLGAAESGLGSATHHLLLSFYLTAGSLGQETPLSTDFRSGWLYLGLIARSASHNVYELCSSANRSRRSHSNSGSCFGSSYWQTAYQKGRNSRQKRWNRRKSIG